jgi:hypothetical protein
MKFMQVWELRGPLVRTDKICAGVGVPRSPNLVGGECAGEL